MINLLPPDAKKQLLAGRANRLLSRYLVLFIAFAALVLMAIGFTYLYLNNLKSTYQQTIDENVTATLHMSDSQRQVSEFRANLATAKQILDNQINYSAGILRLAGSLPEGVIIEQITLDAETPGTPIQFTAHIKSAAVAERLKKSLHDSPYFEEMYYETLTIKDDDSDYPFSLVFTTVFSQELLSDE